MHDKEKNPDCADGPIILKAPGHHIVRRSIDPDALKIIDRLDKQGFMACLVGGAVRDLMLGRAPKDFDVATDARPGQIKKRFANAYVIGRRFRLVHVHFPGDKIIEVATFRRPISGEEEAAQAALEAQGLETRPIDPYGTPREDAFRRDITINALLYDAVLDSVIDYVGGLEDLKMKRVRVIGDPVERFTEDPVRIWRVLRHAARLGFEIEEKALQAIRSHGHLLETASGARLYEEFNKDLAAETRPVIDILLRHKILRFILGPVGRDYEIEAALSARLDGLLDIEGKARKGGVGLSAEEMYALIFFPWAEHFFGRDDIDLHKTLHDEFLALRTAATIPKLVRANAVLILTILGTMIRALRTGRMRWSLQKRSHYVQADHLFFLVVKHRPPAEGESFETIFRSIHGQGVSRPDHRPRWRGYRPPRKPRPS
jgi:poly(A) polymerase